MKPTVEQYKTVTIKDKLRICHSIVKSRPTVTYRAEKQKFGFNTHVDGFLMEIGLTFKVEKRKEKKRKANK